MNVIKVTLHQRISTDVAIAFTTEYVATAEDSEAEAEEAGASLNRQITAFSKGFAEAAAD